MFCFCHVCQNITPGMKLWGAVAEVNEKDLVVSLPGGLRGLVNASDVVDPIFDNKIEVHITLLFFIFLRSPCCFLPLNVLAFSALMVQLYFPVILGYCYFPITFC